MPVYHIILHTYGSWLPNKPEGYYDRKNDGRQRTDEILSGAYQNSMSGGTVELTYEQQAYILQSATAYIRDQQWGMHAIAVTKTHIHMLLSWDTKQTVTDVISKIKQTLTWRLKQNKHDARSHKIFSRGAGIAKVRDWDHLFELVKKYIPSHGQFVEIEERIRLKL